jgi:putative FmdB family regulatory protein
MARRSSMPTYEYACTSCGEHLDAVQSFSDDPLTTCPNCGGQLRKVFGAVGIVLKGSGFYKTDSRSSSSASRSGSSSNESGGKESGSSGESSSSSEGSANKSDKGDKGDAKKTEPKKSETKAGAAAGS